jgi:hypothetical protein
MLLFLVDTHFIHSEFLNFKLKEYDFIVRIVVIPLPSRNVGEDPSLSIAID